MSEMSEASEVSDVGVDVGVGIGVVDALEVRMVPVSAIRPARYNPRKDLTPEDDEYQRIARSLDEFGLVEPLVWNEVTGNLVGGHQRLKVLLARGVTEVPCAVVRIADEAREQALNLALNKVSGAWDLPKLKDLLEELDTGAFDLEITGFSLEEVERLMTQVHVPPADQEGPGGSAGLGDPVIAYNIVFDDESQQQAWYGFLKWLRTEYPDLDTLGARLARFIQDNGYGA
jgi:hypothetical protein